MRQVALTFNGRTYRLACGEGEEARLQLLADHLAEHLGRLTAEFGQIGDDRLLVMAALLVTDELFEARAMLQSVQAEREKAFQELAERGAAMAAIIQSATRG